MQPIVTDSNVVCWSVCHSGEPYRNGWTNWDAIWVRILRAGIQPTLDPYAEAFL